MKALIPMIILLMIALTAGCGRTEKSRVSGGAPGYSRAAPDEIGHYLHVPSPAWEDQVVYFIITDLFNDGDTTNNDQGAGEYRKGGEYTFNGGDLKGITEKLGYIRELGATAIWITPPVANQWWNPERTLTGRHGYWASSFMEVDPHFGTLDEYRELSASLHKNGMCLIQDVVVNHTGDFFTYSGPYDPDDVTKNFKLRDLPQPTQFPFFHNDARKSEDREMAIYHFTPNIVNYLDNTTKRIYQFADLDDINTSNPLVREVLRASYNYWIGEVGVDGFRYDTPLYVEHDFWHDFIHSGDSTTPGVVTYARSLGKEFFLNFGETGVTAMPFEEQSTLEVASYLGTPDEPEMNSVMNYPLFHTIQRVFGEMQPTHLLTYRLESNQAIFDHPEHLINLIDDHNGERFLTRGSHGSFRQALMFILTIPGIPVIYYGTEQDLSRGYRQAMFRGGLGSPDRDQFQTDTESYKFLQQLITIRKNHAVLTRGTLEILRDSPEGPGVFAYRMNYNDEFALILMNTSRQEKLAAGIGTGLEPGLSLLPAYTLSGGSTEVVTDPEGNIHAFLPPQEGMIIFSEDSRKAPGSRVKGTVRIEPFPDQSVNKEMLNAEGSAEGVSTVIVIIDGDGSHKVQTTVDGKGRWSVEIPVHHLLNGVHHVMAYSKEMGRGKLLISDPQPFRLELESRLVARVEDPAGDDHGPGGSYSYPTYATFGHQQDITGVAVFGLGTNLKIELTMAEITRFWNPPNGFDHVLVNIYIDLPHQGGVPVLPLQNATMPDGGKWDYLISTAGYVNTFYTSEGAGPGKTGRVTGPVPLVQSDTAKHTITYLISAEALGFPESLEGTRIYINTWGGSPGALRPLKPRPEAWTFGGGEEHDPKMMDDTEVIWIRDTLER